MDFIQASTSRRVCLSYKVVPIGAVLMNCDAETNGQPLHGQGVLIHWALDLILKEVDKEAGVLSRPDSSFHCPGDWSWDSLKRFSLHLQHGVATHQGPIIWSVLTTIAISKNWREANRTEEEGDKRDPWQVG